MTEQELREKIVKVLEEYRDWFIEEDYKRDIAKIDYTGIADALIEAGIGDISEYKHRVEIAERAVKNLVGKIKCNVCAYSKECSEPIEGNDECLKFYLQQAEKELAEEGKDVKD